MNSPEECCCVCLNKFLGLNILSKKDESNVTLLIKLRTSIPQIEWKNCYKICEPCTNLLNIVHNFRETCLKSENVRKLQLENFNSSVQKELSVKAETNLPDEKDSSVQGDEDESCNDDSNDENYSDEENKAKMGVNVEFLVKNEGEDDDDDEDDDDEEEEDETESAIPKRKRKNLSFQCERCPNKYLSSTVLVRHCVDEHGMNGKHVRPFACTRCNSRFGNSSNLLQHIKYHEAVRSNMCTYCGKGFITKTDLKIHEKQHMNMREYKCEDCSKCFNTHKDLRSHKLVVHTDPQLWKYFCQMCNKHFPIKSNYDSHMRRHTGDKRFECHLCHRKFTDKCVLQRHMRTHSNVRDFKCAHCVKEYKDKRVLQIHMAKVHGIGVGEIKLPTKERRYICHICPKSYYAKNKLTRHLYTHSGEKPFFCNICDKKFNDKSYVKQHMKRTHNIEEYD